MCIRDRARCVGGEVEQGKGRLGYGVDRAGAHPVGVTDDVGQVVACSPDAGHPEVDGDRLRAVVQLRAVLDLVTNDENAPFEQRQALREPSACLLYTSRCV